MSEIPKDLKYSKSHEWVRLETDGSVTVGITDYAQKSLGDLVYVELPAVGDSFETEAHCGVVESVKAASDIYSPISGEVIEFNGSLSEMPELVNGSPYEEGWLFKLKPTDNDNGLEQLLSADEYTEIVAEEE